MNDDKIATYTDPRSGNFLGFEPSDDNESVLVKIFQISNMHNKTERYQDTTIQEIAYRLQFSENRPLYEKPFVHRLIILSTLTRDCM